MHKCFISSKDEDIRYKRYIIEKYGSDNFIDKSLNYKIQSNDCDYIMSKIREDHLSDSTVTIFLIGPHSSEKEGHDIYGEDINYYIKKELQASLYDGKVNTRNGILGIVLPEVIDKIFLGEYTCNICGKNHNYVKIDDDTVIREFSYNYYIKPHSGCAWSKNEEYCVLCTWGEFLKNPEYWIDKAYNKREEDISKKVTVFDFGR